MNSDAVTLWSSDSRVWTVLAIAAVLWIWGALPISRWVKHSVALAAIQLARGAVVILALQGLFPEAENGLVFWLAGFWTFVAQVTSPFYRGRSDRPRGFFLSAGALAILAPWAALGGALGSAGARVIQTDGHERKRMEIGGIAGAALGGVIAYRLGSHFTVGVVWMLSLLQKQSENIEQLLSVQKQVRGSLR